MKKNLDVTKPQYNKQFCQSLGPSLYRGSTVLQFPFILEITKTNYVTLLLPQPLCSYI